MEKLQIATAVWEDLPQILALQYSAYQSEALLLNNYDIPPLKQTLPELQQEYEQGLILKLTDRDGKIIGSVRAYEKTGSVYVGKLMVLPECQRQGWGSRLLLAVEKTIPASRYELFTSSKSAQNLYLYQKAGYKIFDEKQIDAALTLIYLEKQF
ncbi:GNAT family N-acetyltransferase [Phascolarctobacterium sp.]|uniref:GNAT family N-acetyltransferase n=1 Tax=Phascolarctobacterium sp. TaxID=2049039 RepID=UPI0015B06A45|nr:GNAT family N-acetyltransferase [uncultured Phascolarctobacterium sp.]